MAAVIAAAPAGPVDVRGAKNERGIPAMTFVEDVEAYLASKKATVEELIAAFNEMHSKYKFMEQSLTAEKAQLKNKIPEIRRTLEMVEALQAKQEAGEAMTTHFNLADNVFAKATVEGVETVCLWLGANVMVEYTYAEAMALLTENLEGAERKLKTINDDLDFLRGQIITSEVNIARVFNHDVKVRRAARDAAAAASEKEEGGGSSEKK
mmetsp:Transcript_22108/g.77477  ORF Transcript_22108/g.77477 Transcript_22108/m.77477 type:complete len:209 (-) Transcript_22108:31-657(-)